MTQIGTELSEATAAAVERAGGRRARGGPAPRSLERDRVVRGRVIVAAHHNLEWDEDIGIGLHDGTVCQGERDRPRSDHRYAVLRAPLSGLAVPEWASDGVKVGHFVLVLTAARPDGARQPRGRSRPGRRVAHLRRRPIDRYLQTDVDVKTGFSGSCSSTWPAGRWA